MSERGRRHFAFARFASHAVISQALISAASFAIGLILIRRTSDIQYGYYVLASSAILLLTSLQNAFFNPPLARRIVKLDAPERSALVGALYREQRRIVPAIGAIAAVVTVLLWCSGLLDSNTGSLVLVTIVAIVAVLHREYFRMVLFAYRNPRDVLRSDVFYVALLIVGALGATFTAQPAIVAVVTLTLAALVGGTLLARTQRQKEPWDIAGAPDVLRDIAPLAMWSVTGAAIHWSFSQGYMYVVAGTLDVASVAAIAATRLLLMPVNLLATSMGPLMLPLTSGWLHEHGPAVVLRRLSFFALGLASATTVYFGVLWLLRDWIFLAILKKHFPQSDTLLLLWGLTFLVTVVRSQFNWLLAAEGRFRYMTLLTLACAVISLATSYFAMLRFGTVGAVAGILLGEVISAIGIMTQVVRRSPDPIATPA